MKKKREWLKLEGFYETNNEKQNGSNDDISSLSIPLVLPFLGKNPDNIEFKRSYYNYDERFVMDTLKFIVDFFSSPIFDSEQNSLQAKHYEQKNQPLQSSMPSTIDFFGINSQAPLSPPAYNTPSPPMGKAKYISHWREPQKNHPFFFKRDLQYNSFLSNTSISRHGPTPSMRVEWNDRRGHVLDEQETGENISTRKPYPIKMGYGLRVPFPLQYSHSPGSHRLQYTFPSHHGRRVKCTSLGVQRWGGIQRISHSSKLSNISKSYLFSIGRKISSFYTPPMMGGEGILYAVRPKKANVFGFTKWKNGSDFGITKDDEENRSLFFYNFRTFLNNLNTFQFGMRYVRPPLWEYFFGPTKHEHAKYEINSKQIWFYKNIQVPFSIGEKRKDLNLFPKVRFLTNRSGLHQAPPVVSGSVFPPLGKGKVHFPRHPGWEGKAKYISHASHDGRGRYIVSGRTQSKNTISWPEIDNTLIKSSDSDMDEDKIIHDTVYKETDLNKIKSSFSFLGSTFLPMGGKAMGWDPMKDYSSAAYENLLNQVLSYTRDTITSYKNFPTLLKNDHDSIKLNERLENRSLKTGKTPQVLSSMLLSLRYSIYYLENNAYYFQLEQKTRLEKTFLKNLFYRNKISQYNDMFSTDDSIILKKQPFSTNRYRLRRNLHINKVSFSVPVMTNFVSICHPFFRGFDSISSFCYSCLGFSKKDLKFDCFRPRLTFQAPPPPSLTIHLPLPWGKAKLGRDSSKIRNFARIPTRVEWFPPSSGIFSSRHREKDAMGCDPILDGRKPFPSSILQPFSVRRVLGNPPLLSLECNSLYPELRLTHLPHWGEKQSSFYSLFLSGESLPFSRSAPPMIRGEGILYAVGPNKKQPVTKWNPKNKFDQVIKPLNLKIWSKLMNKKNHVLLRDKIRKWILLSKTENKKIFSGKKPYEKGPACWINFFIFAAFFIIGILEAELLAYPYSRRTYDALSQTSNNSLTKIQRWKDFIFQKPETWYQPYSAPISRLYRFTTSQCSSFIKPTPSLETKLLENTILHGGGTHYNTRSTQIKRTISLLPSSHYIIKYCQEYYVTNRNTIQLPKLNLWSRFIQHRIMHIKKHMYMNKVGKLGAMLPVISTRIFIANKQKKLCGSWSKFFSSFLLFRAKDMIFTNRKFASCSLWLKPSLFNTGSTVQFSGSHRLQYTFPSHHERRVKCTLLFPAIGGAEPDKNKIKKQLYLEQDIFDKPNVLRFLNTVSTSLSLRLYDKIGITSSVKRSFSTNRQALMIVSDYFPDQEKQKNKNRKLNSNNMSHSDTHIATIHKFTTQIEFFGSLKIYAKRNFLGYYPQAEFIHRFNINEFVPYCLGSHRSSGKQKTLFAGIKRIFPMHKIRKKLFTASFDSLAKCFLYPPVIPKTSFLGLIFKGAIVSSKKNKLRWSLSFFSVCFPTKKISSFQAPPFPLGGKAKYILQPFSVRRGLGNPPSLSLECNSLYPELRLTHLPHWGERLSTPPRMGGEGILYAVEPRPSQPLKASVYPLQWSTISASHHGRGRYIVSGRTVEPKTIKRRGFRKKRFSQNNTISFTELRLRYHKTLICSIYAMHKNSITQDMAKKKSLLHSMISLSSKVSCFCYFKNKFSWFFGQAPLSPPAYNTPFPSHGKSKVHFTRLPY